MLGSEVCVLCAELMSKPKGGFEYTRRAMFPGKFNRTVLWDVLKLFSITALAMTLVISLGLVGQQLVMEGIGWLAILKLLPFICLIALRFSLPATLLFSACCVFGRMAADNEIVALKSAGISPFRVIRPMVVLGFLVSVPAVWIEDLAVSWGRPGMERVILRSIEEVLYNRLRARRSYETDKGFTIHVQDVQNRWLIEPTIFLFNDSTGKPMTINAEKAQISIDPENDRLVIELVNSYGEINNDQSTRFRLPGSEKISMPLTQASKNGSQSASPSQFAISDIPNEIATQTATNDRRRESMAVSVAVGLALGRYSQLDDPKIQSLQETVNASQKFLVRLQLEPARRWALGFSCFFFVWMGVPMAILIRSADYAWTFGLCFVPILLIYYPLFGLALDRAKDGSWPAMSLWLGNVVLFILGTWMLRRVVWQ
jgi:lipopolysaccharide export system permease protein